MVISDIPHSEGENLFEIAKILVDSLEVPLMEYHTGAIQRLPSKKQPQPIIMNLNNLETRHDLIKSAKRKKLSDARFGVEDNPIFIDKHLSKETVELLRKARELRDQGNSCGVETVR